METTTLVPLGIIGILTICLMFLTKLYLDLKANLESYMDFTEDLMRDLTNYIKTMSVMLESRNHTIKEYESEKKAKATCKTDNHFKAEMAKRKKKGTKKRPYTKRKASFWLDVEARKRRGMASKLGKEAKRAAGTELPKLNNTF